MFLSKMAHCGGREGAAAGADNLLSSPHAQGKIAMFAQSGGLLIWSGPNE